MLWFGLVLFLPRLRKKRGLYTVVMMLAIGGMGIGLAACIPEETANTPGTPPTVESPFTPSVPSTTVPPEQSPSPSSPTPSPSPTVPVNPNPTATVTCTPTPTLGPADEDYAHFNTALAEYGVEVIADGSFENADASLLSTLARMTHRSVTAIGHSLNNIEGTSFGGPAQAFTSLFGNIPIALVSFPGPDVGEDGTPTPGVPASRTGTQTGSYIRVPQWLVFNEQPTPTPFIGPSDGINLLTHEIWHDVINRESDNYFPYELYNYNPKGLRSEVGVEGGIVPPGCGTPCEVSTDVAAGWSLGYTSNNEPLNTWIEDWIFSTVIGERP